MRKFIFRIFIFSIPLFLVLMPPLWYLYKAKENFFDLERFLKNSNTEKYLIGYAYNEKNYRYLKWKSISINPKCDVWSIGSSRAMQFRKEMFVKSFYNAGFIVRKINEFLPLMKSIDSSKHPDVLIITLDTWMFNANYDKVDEDIDETKWSNSFSLNPNFQILKSVWKDIIVNKFESEKIYNSNGFNRIGCKALYKNSGFRNDGSFYYGQQIQKLLIKDSTCSDYNFKNTFSRIDRGIKLFEYGNTPNPKAFEELEKFLDYCQNNSIMVVLIMPPFAKATYNKMLTSGNYKYIQHIPEKCNILAKKYGFEFYNFTAPIAINSDDNEFIDGFHGSEKVYLKMLINIMGTKSILNKESNIDKLKKDLDASISDYQVYKN